MIEVSIKIDWDEFKDNIANDPGWVLKHFDEVPARIKPIPGYAEFIFLFDDEDEALLFKLEKA